MGFMRALETSGTVFGSCARWL